jgi:hypothetical protein
MMGDPNVSILCHPERIDGKAVTGAVEPGDQHLCVFGHRFGARNKARAGPAPDFCNSPVNTRELEKHTPECEFQLESYFLESHTTISFSLVEANYTS